MAAPGTAAALAPTDPDHTVIGPLVPAPVVAVDTTTDVGLDHLFPAELEVVARAVAKRQNEFSTVRWCARQALSELGVEPGPILPGVRGAPQWPAGIVGSMTHCAGYRAAVVARAEQVRSVGIDAEPHLPLPEGVLDVIARPEEREQLAELARDRDQHWDRLLFSIKESVYKTWFPITGRWLDFAEASIRIDPSAGAFRAELLTSDPALAGLTGFDGVYRVHDDLVVSLIALMAS